MKTPSTIAVIGGGIMGSGIAQTAALAGHRTLLFDISKEAIERAQNNIAGDLDKGVALGKLKTEAAEFAKGNLIAVNDPDQVSEARLLIEAVSENLELKKKIFGQFAKVVSRDAILASNTSSFSITELAAAVPDPHRFLGIHFFNPVPRMTLVEVTSGRHTDSRIHQEVCDLMKKWGKTPVGVRDTPGFIVNRVARPFYCESLRILEEGIADAPTIDHALKSLGGFRMGPFELLDLIGIDTNFSITSSLYEAYYHEPRYRPSLLQKRMVDAGLHGRKTEKGFYDYSEGFAKPSPNPDKKLLDSVFRRILACLINEAAEALYQGIATAQDLDTAVQKGMNYPKGLLAWGAEIGYANCLAKMDELFDFYRDPRYRASAWLRNHCQSRPETNPM